MTSNYVDNVMVYADPFHNYCVALVVPSRHILEKWAKEAGMTYRDFPELCEKVEAVKEVQQSLLKVCPFNYLVLVHKEVWNSKHNRKLSTSINYFDVFCRLRSEVVQKMCWLISLAKNYLVVSIWTLALCPVYNLHSAHLNIIGN